MILETRPLAEADLPEADRIFRLAFSTFIGLPDPAAFMPGADLVFTRWRADPAATLGAYADGRLVGSNFAANWGSFGFFGPLTVHPDLWNQGIARRLLEPMLLLLERRGVRQMALFTFPDSPKHHAFYGGFGFRPRRLTAILTKPVAPRSTPDWSAFSSLPADAKARCLDDCRALTQAVHAGLDLSREITAVAAQGLGDIVLVHDDGALAAFAVCHLGAGSEAGQATAYVKFGAARPGVGAAKAFQRLLAACEALAGARGLATLACGVNLGRVEAHQVMLAQGFTKATEGIAMYRPDDPAHSRADRFVVDDWR